MEITATELKLNLGKYLEAANDESIVITKNGKAIAQLIGVRTFTYDFSELEQWAVETAQAYTIGEGRAAAYGAAGAVSSGVGNAVGKSVGNAGANESGSADSWILTRNGEPVAALTPILKQKKKRRLGFIDGPPASEETIAALFESDWTDEDEERWLNEK